VTIYLSEKEVRNTLKEIKEHTASGSIVVADFYAKGFVTGEYAPGWCIRLRLSLRKMGKQGLFLPMNGIFHLKKRRIF